jgi:ABC-type phosphate transport system substrate-binding protein
MTTLLFVIMLAVGAPSAPADVQVIANPSVGVSELTPDEVRDIFLGSKTAIGGATVAPVFGESGAAHESFLRNYLGKSDAALRNYYKTLVFTGKGTLPKAFGSEAEVLRYVTATKGAIGYVSASADTGGAKKLQVK